MTIKCLICDREFSKQITNSHLKLHGITTKEYKEKFDLTSLSSEEYKNELSSSRLGENNPNFGNKWDEEEKLNLSKKLKGRTPHNKGKKYSNTSVQKESALKRENRYKNGELTRKKIIVTDTTKEKISKSLKKYAEENPEHCKKLSENAKNAIDKRREAGTDLAFFRGKKHSEKTKKILSDVSSKHAKIKSDEKIKKINEKCKELNFSIIGNIDNYYLTLHCGTCDTNFNVTSQAFRPSKYNSEICPTCYPRAYTRSKGEIEVFEFIKKFDNEVIANYRNVEDNKFELDMYSKKYNVAIEYNGLYWHSSQINANNGKHEKRDYIKHKEVTKNGIRLITLFEDEWIHKQEIVKSRLENIFGNTKNVIYARKCTIKEIDSKTSNSFCNQNHIQGKARSNVRVGLFYNEKLVSVMTFSNTNLSRRITEWELNRFCNLLNYNVIGAAGKLFKYFINKYNPESVLSYSDNRWSSGNVYKKIGFEFIKETEPGYWYVYPNTTQRIHRYTLRKNKNDNPELTEKENRELQGYIWIYDCGHGKWLWKNKGK